MDGPDCAGLGGMGAHHSGNCSAGDGVGWVPTTVLGWFLEPPWNQTLTCRVEQSSCSALKVPAYECW